VDAYRLPVFPLPDVVFFPGTVLPLHVFEPRYRRMVADCLAGDRWLAVVRLRPGWEKDYEGRPPIHSVAGAGEIMQAEAFPDGRFNILLDGRCRVRIEGEEPTGGRPYRVVQARRLPDRIPEGEGSDLVAPLQELRLAHEKLLVALGQTHAEVVARLTVAGVGAGAVVDRIVAAVVPDAGMRQRILETVEVQKRLELARAALAELLAFVAGRTGDDETDDE
jgi:hypothetical protein